MTYPEIAVNAPLRGRPKTDQGLATGSSHLARTFHCSIPFHLEGLLSPGSSVPAKAPDDIIEALEGPGPAFVLAVQFHPEELVGHDERMQRLFEFFVEAANAPTSILWHTDWHHGFEDEFTLHCAGARATTRHEDMIYSASGTELQSKHHHSP